MAGGQSRGLKMSDKTEADIRDRAVAIEHDPERAPVPRITAVGFGANAEQIVDLAHRNGVKVREDADLAEILSAFEVDSLVPLDAIRAVAEILSYLYRADGSLDEHRAELDAMKEITAPDNLADPETGDSGQ